MNNFAERFPFYMTPAASRECLRQSQARRRQVLWDRCEPAKLIQKWRDIEFRRNELGR